MMQELLVQAGKALLYYAALLILMRLAGKRLAGQTTTFDLIVLISLAVVLQMSALDEGLGNAIVFVVTVFAAHRLLAVVCARCAPVRHLIRGKPRALVREGHIIDAALDEERMSRDELLAGLRKLGFDDPGQVKLAVLEETGHISAVARE